MPKGKSVRFGSHARDDSGVADERGIISIDVLANDRGGSGAKAIWSLDQADPGNFSDFAELPGGATVGIGTDGNLLYKAVDKFDYLAEGEIAYDSFTYAMRLGNGVISVATVTVQITGVNDPAQLSKAQVHLVEGDDAAAISTSGTLTISDIDSPETFVAGSQIGLYGTFTIEEDGDWTYQASSAHDEFQDEKTYRDRFVVESADGTTTKVEIVIVGTADEEASALRTANAVTGDAGANILKGGSGSDLIEAGAGNDRLYGRAGNDSLEGGAGRDRFYFDSALGGANVDAILDFSARDDTIYLARGIFAKAGANGALGASAFHNGAAAADAGDRIVYDQASGEIFYDADGSGGVAQILFATVTPGTALTHADFVIYG